jgi:protein SCO1
VKQRTAPILALLGLGAVLAAPARAADAPRYTRAVAAYQAPDVTLVDAARAAVPLKAELAKPGPLVLQFVFTTCPGICPALSGSVAALLAERPELRALSISIDPEEDSPARLAAYAARFRAGAGWRFLTGRLEDVRAVQRAFDAYRGEDKMRHEPLTFLRAAPGAPWVRLQGFPTVAELQAELARLPAR